MDLEVGKRLEQALEVRGMTQIDLGRAMGRGRKANPGGNISGWINDKDRLPRLIQIEQICKILGISPCWLAFGMGEMAGGQSPQAHIDIMEGLPLETRELLKLLIQKSQVGSLKPKHAASLKNLLESML